MLPVGGASLLRPTLSRFSDSMTLKICVAQLNFVVGDMAGNARRIIDAAQQRPCPRCCAAAADARTGACVAMRRKTCSCDPLSSDACDDALKQPRRRDGGAQRPAHRGGTPFPAGFASGRREPQCVGCQDCFNAASVISEGRITHTYAKRELPNYQVFDERRYFVPGHQACVFEVQGDDDGV